MKNAKLFNNFRIKPQTKNKKPKCVKVQRYALDANGKGNLHSRDSSINKEMYI